MHPLGNTSVESKFLYYVKTLNPKIFSEQYHALLKSNLHFIHAS